MKTNLTETETEESAVAEHGDDDAYGRDALRDNGRKCDPRHVHIAHDDEEQIQEHVDDSRRGEEVKGAFCVAGRTHNGGAEVVDHRKGESDEVNDKIGGREVDDLIRCFHHGEENMRRSGTDDPDDQPRAECEHHRGVDDFLSAFPVTGTVAPRHEDIGTDAEPDEQLYVKIDEGTGRGNSGDAVRGAELSADNQIGGIIK